MKECTGEAKEDEGEFDKMANSSGAAQKDFIFIRLPVRSGRCVYYIFVTVCVCVLWYWERVGNNVCPLFSLWRLYAHLNRSAPPYMCAQTLSSPH